MLRTASWILGAVTLFVLVVATMYVWWWRPSHADAIAAGETRTETSTSSSTTTVSTVGLDHQTTSGPSFAQAVSGVHVPAPTAMASTHTAVVTPVVVKSIAIDHGADVAVTTDDPVALSSALAEQVIRPDELIAYYNKAFENQPKDKCLSGEARKQFDEMIVKQGVADIRKSVAAEFQKSYDKNKLKVLVSLHARYPWLRGFDTSVVRTIESRRDDIGVKYLRQLTTSGSTAKTSIVMPEAP